jgi:Divergent InlB B-repeat domain
MIMNKSSYLLVVAMTIAVSISGLKAFSIFQIPPSSDPTKFSLTVQGGSPSGNYAAGTQVTVSADAPKAGAKFAGWTGDVAILANPFLPTTTATIPFMAVTITATYTAP